MTKVIDVSDKAVPLPKGYDFPLLEPDLDLDPDASVFDAVPISRMERPQGDGMAPKPRDSVVGMMIQNFIARHGLRLVGFFPQVRAGRFLCDGSPHGLPRRGPRPLGAEKGLTRVPPRAIVTKAGDRWVTPYEEARLRHYTPVPGDAAYKAQVTIRSEASVYADRLSVQASPMSLADGKHYRRAVPESQKLPREGVLPERHCQNPECLKEIDEKRHHNVQYCNAKCTARAKELRRLQRKNREDGRPILYRNESDVSDDFSNDTNQLETSMVSPHICAEMFSEDCPVEIVR